MNAAPAVRGFILLPVLVTLALVAVLAFLVNRDSGISMSMAARGLDADAARYAAEAGLSQINNATQRLNCAGYTNLSAVSFGSARISASVAPNSGTPVTLSSSATTASGAAASLTRANVVVHQTTPYVLTLQPGANGLDTYIDSVKQTFNYGADTTIYLKGGGKDNGLMKFDLAAIPPGALIQSAQLGVYTTNASSGPSDSLTLYRVTRQWTEGSGSGSATADGATWNATDGTLAWSTAGGDYDASTGVSTAFAGTVGWSNFDLAALVSDWAAGTVPNYGMLLVPSAGVVNATISSSDNATVAQRPVLTVTFLPPCGWTPPLSSQTLAPTADSGLDRTHPTTKYGAATWLLINESSGQRGVFRFDTSTIPAGTPLASATLRLYIGGLFARSGGSMNLEVHALGSDWTESIVTWNKRTAVSSWTTAGGDYQSAAAGTLVLPASFNGGWIEFKITALAQAWVDGVSANNGVIVLETSPDWFLAASREAGASTAPQLVLDY